MKIYTRIICILVNLVILLNSHCFAAYATSDESLLQVNWSGKYMDSSNPVLEIDVMSSAGYIQTIAVAMYDDVFDAESEDNRPAFTDYYRMDEVVLKKGEVRTLRFKITNNGTPLEDGAYKILIQGSGKSSEESRVQIPVWVIKPLKIEGLLYDFNHADVSNMMDHIEDVEKPLQLEVADSESTARLNAFLNIRDKDYSGNFANLEDIKETWSVSEIIECLTNDSANKVRLQSLFENNASIIGIDVVGSDYKDNTTEIYNSIVYNNSLGGATSKSNLKELFSQATAITMINGAKSETISNTLATYYDEIGISDANYNKLSNCTDDQLVLKIERMFLNKDFKTAAKIKETFDNAVNTYIKENGSGLGSGSDSGSGKEQAPIKVPDAKVDATADSSTSSPSAKGSFKDVTTEHWAYNYIETLKDSGIISGYSDGKFYPDRTVKREEFVKMAVLMCDLNDENAECKFKDVLGNAWYYTYVSSAYKTGIISGLSEERFGVGSDISRQDVAVIVCRLLEKLDIKTESVGENNEFTDVDAIADYAMESVNMLSKMKVINGLEDGTFRPNVSLTRAEAAKILSLIKSYIN